MTRSLVLVTPDEALARRLAQRLSDGFEVRIFDSIGIAEQALGSPVSATILADFRHAAHGGHQEARFLEKLVETAKQPGATGQAATSALPDDRRAPRPAPRVVVLTSPDCPEPLVRVAVLSGCRSLSAPVTDELLAESLLENDDDRASNGREARDSAVEHQSEISEPCSARAPILHSRPHSDPRPLTPDPAERSTAEAHSPPQPRAELRGGKHVFTTHSAALAPMLRDLDVAASHDVTLLIIGETGSGKTFLSHVVHELSPRRDERFLVVACGALPPDLIESELFGHVKGAFTGAHADKEGKFAAAGRGTLLLDEIDVLGLDQQAKLLRVIETGEYEPVGSNETRHSRARLIVAGNQDLEPLAEAGKFRPDLYYRLNVLKFTLPPLRERPEDIVALTRSFIDRFRAAHNVDVRQIDPQFMKAVEAYAWPGNVRELENTIRRAVILCRAGRLTLDQLPPNVVQAYIAGNGRTPPRGHCGAPPASLEQKVALTQREIIEAALRKNNYRRTATARELGISRVTLYNKMKKYGVAG